MPGSFIDFGVCAQRGAAMKVYMLKDVENVGMTGQIVNVSEGYAANFLVPRKLAQAVTAKNEAFLAQRAKKAQVAVEALNSKMAMMAERLKKLNISIKKRQHDDGKLYGAVSADDIVDLLKAKDFTISKKQVVFKKSVKTVGEHKVAIKLSSKLQPEVSLKVVGTEV
jgi:large subunit ribosomal protein L9